MNNFESNSSFEFEESERNAMLDSLRKVGQEKSIGYLPLDTLTSLCHVDPKLMQKELEERGLRVIILDQEQSNVGSGAFFAYDEAALAKLLLDNSDTLVAAGWPTDPEQFVRHLHVFAEPKTALFDLIADAFGDMSNPGRSIRR